MYLGFEDRLGTITSLCFCWSITAKDTALPLINAPGTYLTSKF